MINHVPFHIHSKSHGRAFRKYARAATPGYMRISPLDTTIEVNHMPERIVLNILMRPERLMSTMVHTHAFERRLRQREFDMHISVHITPCDVCFDSFSLRCLMAPNINLTVCSTFLASTSKILIAD